MVQKATTRQLQAAALFMAGGWMPSGASAMVGNLSQESGVSLPSAFRTGRLDHGSQGLPQWRLERLDDYQAWVDQKHSELAGDDDAMWVQYGRLDYQCEYIMVEMKRDYPGLDAKLRAGGSVSALVADICWQYERPSRAYANLANRIDQGLRTFNSLPQGATTANKTNVVAALDAQADAHKVKKQAGIATTIMAGGVGFVGTLAHAAPHLHWYEWVTVFAVAFLAVSGLSAYFTHDAAEGLIRNAKTGVDGTAKPNAAAQPVSAPAAQTSAPTQKSHRDAATVAKAEEQAAIDAALAKSAAVETSTVSTTAALQPAPATAPVVGPSPIMSVHTPSQETQS